MVDRFSQNTAPISCLPFDLSLGPGISALWYRVTRISTESGSATWFLCSIRDPWGHHPVRDGIRKISLRIVEFYELRDGGNRFARIGTYYSSRAAPSGMPGCRAPKGPEGKQQTGSLLSGKLSVEITTPGSDWALWMVRVRDKPLSIIDHRSSFWWDRICFRLHHNARDGPQKLLSYQVPLSLKCSMLGSCHS